MGTRTLPIVLVSQCPGVPVFWCPSVQVSRCPSVPVSQCPNVLVSWFVCPDVPVSWCPSLPVYQCPSNLWRTKKNTRGDGETHKEGGDTRTLGHWDTWIPGHQNNGQGAGAHLPQPCCDFYFFHSVSNFLGASLVKALASGSGSGIPHFRTLSPAMQGLG